MGASKTCQNLPRAALACAHKYLGICELCKELCYLVRAHTLFLARRNRAVMGRRSDPIQHQFPLSDIESILPGPLETGAGCDPPSRVRGLTRCRSVASTPVPGERLQKNHQSGYQDARGNRALTATRCGRSG